MGEDFLVTLLSDGRSSTGCWPVGRHANRLQGVSLLLHCVTLALLLQLSVQQIRQTQDPEPSDEPLGRLFLPGKWDGKLTPRGGGDGGDRNPIAPTRGTAPHFRWIQFAPPSPHTVAEAQLLVTPSVQGPPEMRPPEVPANNWGSPLVKDFTGSPGPGERGGIGEGCCGGIGPGGEGHGIGPGDKWGTGGKGTPRAGTLGSSYPVCVYCPNPSYTEEARKAKFQGSVLLRATITVDGRATNIRVTKGAGLGLDEAAIETVRTWRFKPALAQDRQPIETWTEIEINFRLY